MSIYSGVHSTTAEVLDLGAGAGETTCLECGGDGDWTKFLPYTPAEKMSCVQCKGTGRQLVGV